MKRSTIATSTLALAASLVAGISAAGTITNAFENFNSADWTSPNTGDHITNLTWAVGSGDESTISGSALSLDTCGATNTLTIATDAKNDITGALAMGKCAYYSSKVAFVPTTSAEDFSGAASDLKFAIYACVNGASTNLVIYNGSYTTNTSVTITGAPQDVNIAVTNASGTIRFNVAVGGTECGWLNAKDSTFAGLQAVDFTGTGTIDDINFSYEVPANTDPIKIKPDTGSGETAHTLTETEATYLNKIVEAKGASAVNTSLTSYKESEFEKAALLGLDITANTKPTYTFDIKGIKRNSSTEVVVTVVLTRSACIADTNAIYGTLKLYGCDTPNGTYTEIGVAEVGKVNASFETDSTTATATLTFNPNGKKFFKASIQ